MYRRRLVAFTVEDIAAAEGLTLEQYFARAAAEEERRRRQALVSSNPRDAFTERWERGT